MTSPSFHESALLISSTGSTVWPTWSSTDWIPPAVSSLQQYQHHWASGTKHLLHSGQCTFRCGVQHYSVSFEWCRTKQEQSINSAWWDMHLYCMSMINIMWTNILRNLIHCKNRVFTLVAWWTLVLDTNYIRQPVSLLFPPLSSSWNEEKMNKETTTLLALSSDTKTSHTNHIPYSLKLTPPLIISPLTFC